MVTISKLAGEESRIEELFSRGYSVTEITRDLNSGRKAEDRIHRSTVSRYLKRWQKRIGEDPGEFDAPRELILLYRQIKTELDRKTTISEKRGRLFSEATKIIELILKYKPEQKKTPREEVKVIFEDIVSEEGYPVPVKSEEG